VLADGDAVAGGRRPTGERAGGIGGGACRLGDAMGIVYNIALLALVFIVLKTFQLIFDFGYTTYKSVTIHKSMAHAFNPGLGYRLKRGLWGDIVYFVAGIVVALNAEAIRGLVAG
jgi:hypothetical protein